MYRAPDRIRLPHQYDDAADLQTRQQMTDVYVGRSRQRLRRLKELDAPHIIIQAEEKHLVALEKKKRSRTRANQVH